ncbi:hypothetical protein EUGRSUZ_D02121 [Eucalyptus grandis]|uniref:FAD-binding domain-containing protein n=1 Tax=Eucalyptus grandis TaxID=71139 RepID=A0A059CI34_EUCGR|nr:hypothetical protein EUGRSUZ_D02121 [Eucalyptus grandis]
MSSLPPCRPLRWSSCSAAPAAPPPSSRPSRTGAFPRSRGRRRSSRPRALSVRAEAGVLKEDVVIVGAGIAGLATSVSLHRLGVKSLVLEQAESLRTVGTSLTLFKNGWRVLDAIGVGSDLPESIS